MNLLLAGDNEVMRGAVAARLSEAGHSVRLLAFSGARGHGNEPRAAELHGADRSGERAIAGAAADCAAIVVLGDIGPDAMRSLVAEAESEGVPRLIVVLRSVGENGPAQESGASAAAAIAREFSRSWTIVHATHAYGPGDPVLSSLVTMVRTMPMLPVPEPSDRPLQPVAARDLAEAVARILEREDLDRRELNVAGPEVTSLSDILDRIERLTGRTPPRLPVPEEVLAAGMQLAASFGLEVPVSVNPFTALGVRDALPAGSVNALTEVLGVEPMKLDDGLAHITETVPEQLPGEGVGSLVSRRWWTDIRDSAYTAPVLFAWFRGHCGECMESASRGLVTVTAPAALDRGASVTLELPPGAALQLRVIEAREREATLVTVEGHPLAAAISFRADDYANSIRFEVTSVEHAATPLTGLAMSAGGAVLRDLTMASLVECVVRASGGIAIDGVRSEERELEADEAAAEVVRLEMLVERARETRT